MKSTAYKDVKINLGINNKDHQVTFDAQWDIALKTPLPTITAAQTVSLGYLSQFVTPENVKNLTFSIVKETNVVIIIANPGYTFVENGVELPSLTAMPYKIK
ncbi:MAG: hypothetical protein ACRDA7_01170 [Metamycoplasmataceae bacterium]